MVLLDPINFQFSTRAMMVQWREQDSDFGAIDVYVYAYRAACVLELFNMIGLGWRELHMA